MKYLQPFLYLWTVVFGFARLDAAETSKPTTASRSKPNIVFIFADDWGWGDLSCHGHPWLKTPNLDRLASEGIDFQQFNVLNPVCSPSRTAVMTGHYPARYSVHQHFAAPAQNHERGMPDWLDPKAPTLPRFLQQSGYRTAHFGKWHLTNAQTHGAPKPEAYGYDEYSVFNGGAGWPAAGLHATAANAAAFIQANKDKPFFINVWIHESHTPHVPTKESMEKWKHLDAQKQVYAAVITDGDDDVGTILDALKTAGVADNTIVMFSSDNGPEWTGAELGPKKSDPDARVTGFDTYYSVGETGGLRGRKRSVFEGGVRVPFLVRWPGRTPAGLKNDATAFTAVDLLPTLCAAANVELPDDYHGDGENLLEALKGQSVARTRPIFWEWQGTKTEPDYWPRLVVRDGDWKLATADEGKRVELHRLTADRAEATDVAKDYPDIVARLTKLALDWKATLTTMPNPDCLSTVLAPSKADPPKAVDGGYVETVARPDRSKMNSFYVGNREPLLPAPLLKLPIGAIKPQGWLRKQLELQAQGFFGHLPELSRFLEKEDNPWLNPEGEGEMFWEEVPYWLKGYGDLAYVLGDEKMIAEAELWINGVIATQRDDGWFGPRANIASPRVHSRGKPDLWPNMAMLNALQAYYEYSGDERVLRLMTKYFAWQLAVPDDDFLPPLWQKQRAGDNLASVYWLYNRTGDTKLLDLATKIFRKTADWTEGVPDWHNVNISQALRGTPTYYLQSKDSLHLTTPERNYQTVWGLYGQVPGGMFGADENCRPGFHTARQAVETCGMVEMMHSCEEILKISGDLPWADRCEDVAFNSLPAVTTPDFRALRYLTAPNLIISNSKNKSPKIQDPGAKYQMNPHAHRCCQLNMGQGWPYYAEHLWMATPDGGLALVFYSDSKVTAKVGAGTEVTITASTHYPFDENIVLSVSMPESAQFPLYLRVPRWCAKAELTLNDRQIDVPSQPQTFLRINRVWKNGDVVRLKLPMPLSVRTWSKNAKSVSIDRGPLTYSLKISEKYVPIEGAVAVSKEYVPDSWRRELSKEQLAAWPAFEIYPTSPWNYGLVFDKEKLAVSFQVTKKEWPSDENAWGGTNAPIEIKAKGRRIPDWKTDETDLVGLIAEGPVKSEEPLEEITLIPMGAARLRLSVFPVIDNGPGGLAWKSPAEPFVKITPRQAAAMKKAAAGEQDLDVLNAPAKKAAESVKPLAKPTAQKPSAEDRAKTFTRWDTNRDDVVTLAEYLAGQKPNDLLEARFKRLDKNADGKLTRGEFIDPSGM